MPTAKLADAEIYYEFSGNETAPVAVLSNSLGTNLHMWDSQVAEFTNHFRLLRYDTRGHGRSTVTSGPYSIDQLSNDVLHMLDALNLPKVYFCGVSMGGMTGIYLSTHFPDRFHKIAACSTAAKIGTQESWNATYRGCQKRWNEGHCRRGTRSLVYPVLPHNSSRRTHTDARNARGCRS